MRFRSAVLGVFLAASAVSPPAAAEIFDNSFFIEEAYNQEAGVVQHVQTFHWTREREGGSEERGFSYGFTQEWPVGGQRHQLSYTIPYERVFGDQPHVDGIGDVQLHLRYQALMESPVRPAFAPRLTVILPTGDEDRGLGAGSMGLQTNLPFSKAMDRIHLHANAGATFFPGARVTLPSGQRSDRRDLVSTNLGFSVIWLLSGRLHALFEFVTEVEESLDDTGSEEESARVLASPGLRFAIDRKDGAQWVLGAAAPFGVNEAEDDAGVFLYLSFEHGF